MHQISRAREEIKEEERGAQPGQDQPLSRDEQLVWSKIAYNVRAGRVSNCKGFCKGLASRVLDEQNFAIRQLIRALQDLVSVVPGAQSADDSLRLARVGRNINRVCTTNKFVVVCCSSIKKALNETKKYILSRDLRTLRVARELDTG